MIATLVLAALVAGPGIVLEVTEDLELAIEGSERVVSISVTRTCQPDERVLLPGSATVRIVAGHEGVKQRPATIGLPVQACDTTPRLTVFGTVWMRATSSAEPGVFNATAVTEGSFTASDTFSIIVRDPDGVRRVGGREMEATAPADSFITVSDNVQRIASAVATVGLAIGLLRGPRMAGTWGREPFRVHVVPVRPVA